jgi:superfamily II DNA or RNA helicase
MSISSPPITIRRFSSRRHGLTESFLNQRLAGALAYDRIAGYFCGSILETAGEALETVVGPIRVVCNSALQQQDLATARAAAAALRQEWCASKPEALVDAGGEPARLRVSRLYQFLSTGKLEVRILPDTHFGLIHGKAGVITLADGTKTAFLGSVNESKTAWTLNYELLWEDPSPEAAAWVQEEFDALWTHYAAIPLADFIIEDVKRLSRRQVISSVREWSEDVIPTEQAPRAASIFVETPVYRKHVGLWEHQKHFVKLAFDAHLHNPGGARFVLADQVGLGKTIQLAMAAELMALTGSKPILVLAPKTLLWQWQDELSELLDLPSAVWNGRQWTDENEVQYPPMGPDGIKKCPRRIGLVSTGLVTSRSEVADHLRSLSFECVIVDEAHRARRKNLGESHEAEKPDPNNLLEFLHDISSRTKNFLLATATPVQLHPIEGWDLLDALSHGSEAVLGGPWSLWRKSDQALKLITGRRPLPVDELDIWQWVRTPMPPRSEHIDFDILRRVLAMPDSQVSAAGSDWTRLNDPARYRIKNMFPRFVSQHNPFIRHIVRRNRKYLEETRDPETGEPYLKPIGVELFGEKEEDAVRLPLYLRDAYQTAEEFCHKLSQRLRGSGFLRTLLLRRVGSSIEAGRLTAEQMLTSWQTIATPEDDDDDEDRNASREPVHTSREGWRTLTEGERDLLQRFTKALEANQDRDPKYAVVVECLRDRGWLERGCIIFSQYFDSVRWLSEQLAQDFPQEQIGIYAGSGKSGVWRNGRFANIGREEIKDRVKRSEIRLLLGTDAASEGLNLQRLGTLINLDLPWNPTRLEQRKGRIQRIGQINDVVWIYNMRYLGSVEDRVHQLLSSRLQDIYTLFGQVPDVLEDVWIDVAVGELERAKQIIAAVPKQHPFEIKYQKIAKVDWESCEKVLQANEVRRVLMEGW